MLQTPVHTLTTPTAEFPEPFTEVRGVRELTDGRVVVNDFRDRFVKLVDFPAGTVRQTGTHGSGPGEYLMPLMLLPLGRDTTAVYDMANNGDLVIILPDGSLRGSITTAPTTPGGATITTRSRGDGRGFIYSETRTGNDSIAVERYDRRSNGRVILGYVSPLVVSPFRGRPAGGRGLGARGTPTGGVGGSPPPFFTVDQWAVANDGRLAVVTSEPYRVTFTETDGRRWTADPISTSRIRVTEAHKSEWRQTRARPVASISFSRSGERAAGFTSRPVVEPAAWPEYLPPFLTGAVRFAPDGMLWVERTTAAGAPATFDIIDFRGRLVLKVVFPPRTRLAGFGANTIYAVRRDSDDLEYLQKYDLPP
jgi:hypothetical protein